MASSCVLIFIVLSLTMTTVICQTFQYSHGWTNGKRSSSMLEEMANSVGKNAGQLDNVLVECERQKLRSLLQGNVNSQVMQELPCEYFAYSRRNLLEPIANVDRLQRQSTPVKNNY